MKNQLIKTFLASASIVSLLALASCDTVKDKLGLTREAPDEFQVVSQPPLELPPDFTLTPPRPGAPRPQNRPKNTFMGPKPATSQNSTAEKSHAETMFLKEVHAEDRNEDIRNVLTQERTVTTPPPATFMSTLAKQNAQEDETIDPRKEKRLKDNLS